MDNSCISFLERSAEKYPDSIAIDDTVVSYTYAELRGKARVLAKVIHGKSVQLKSPVAVFLPKSSECIVAFMSILYSDNFYVALDVNLPIERLRKIIENIGKSLVLTSRKYVANCEAAGIDKQRIICLDEIVFEGTEYSNLNIDCSKMLNSDPIYLAYTSGSTGEPKGVVVSHKTVMDYVAWAKRVMKFSHKDHIGNQTPFYYVGSDKDIWPCIAVGAKMTLIPQKLFSFPALLVDFLRQHGITSISWVPSVLCMISETDSLSYDRIKNLVLNRIIFTGEPMPTPALNYWRKRLPHIDYFQIYGASESRACMWYKLNRDLSDAEAVPLGYPRDNIEVLLLDENYSLITAPNVIGELYVRGSSLALGYWSDNDRTREVFVQNPLQNNYPEMVYKTGDLAMLNDFGELVYCGRKDAQIKHMGHRIELGEIEIAAQSVEGIKRVCAIYDKGKKEIILFYKSDMLLKNEHILKMIRKRLPAFMMPSRLIRLDDFPQNSNGKIDRVRIIELAK